VATEGRGLPLALTVTTGNTNDSTAFAQVMDTIRVPRPGRGRPRTRPERVIADKACSSKAIRRLLRSRRIGCTIPERSDQKAWRRRRGSYGGRPPVFDRQVYKRRNLVERCIGRLKHYRGIATRSDKLAAHYRAGVMDAIVLP
jgi:transposase